MKKNLLIFCCMAIFLSCTVQETKNKRKHFELQKDYEYVHLIPDSLRTPVQEELYEKLLETVVKNLKVVSNRLVFSLSESEFLKLNIPKPYYDLLQHNIEEINDYFVKNNIKGLDNILLESYKDLYIKFNEK